MFEITSEVFLDVMVRGITVLLSVVTPVLLISMVVGLIIAIFQAVTQINEQTITFVSKIFVVFLTLMFLGGWMIQKLVDYLHELLTHFFNMI